MKNIGKNILKIIFTFSLSGGLYLLIETFYHGYGSMPVYYVAGFVGLIALVMNNIFTYDMDYLSQGFVCGLIATILEGIAGNIWNADFILWDYRGMPFACWNDQICLPFFLAWIILCLAIIPVLDYIEWRLFGYKTDTPPYYVICGKKIFQFKK